MNSFTGFDQAEVKDTATNILQLMKLRCKNKGDALHFENIDINDPEDNKSAIIAFILSEIVKSDKRFSIVIWPTGPALVKTSDVDAISAEDRQLDDQWIITPDNIVEKLGK
jgi:hypothetical protein